MIFASLAGIPELGIEHFEPLILQSVSVSRGSGSLTLAGGFKNLIVKGPSNATVSRARFVFFIDQICVNHNIFLSLIFFSIHFSALIWKRNS